MKDILTQEIDESGTYRFSTINDGVQKKILERKCERCDGDLDSKIDYVACKNGKVIWWHTKHTEPESYSHS